MTRTPRPAPTEDPYQWEDRHGAGPGVYPVPDGQQTLLYDARSDSWHTGDGRPAAAPEWAAAGYGSRAAYEAAQQGP